MSPPPTLFGAADWKRSSGNGLGIYGGGRQRPGRSQPRSARALSRTFPPARSRHGSVGSPQERAQEEKSLVCPPPPNWSVFVQRRLDPSSGSFFGLGTGRCIPPGAPNLFVPGESTAPACSTALRPASPPRAPKGSPSSSAFPAAQPAAAGTPPASPHSAAPAPSRLVPPAQSQGQVQGLGHGRRDPVRPQQSRNTNF